MSNYERRERMKKAAAVKPHERSPAGVKHWPRWRLAEAQRQGQVEMFPGYRSVDPRKEEVKRAKRRRKRRERQPGVFVP